MRKGLSRWSRVYPLLLATAFVSPASAEPGRTAATFLQRNLGARPAGMGNAFVAIPGSIDSIQFNPAALAQLKSKTITSTYLKGFAGSTFGFLAYGHPSRFGTLGAGVVYYNAGDIDLNLSNGTRGRVSAEEDIAWMLSYAAQIFPGLDVGATFRHLRLELAETARTNSSQADVGILWRSPIHGLSAAAAYQYLGPDIRFEEAADPPPRTWRYGLAYQIANLNPALVDPGTDLKNLDLILAADVVETLHEKRSPRLGMEMGLEPFYINRAAIRLGWVFDRDVESFSFGLGFRQGSFGLDYAFAPAKDLGNIQEFTLAFYF